MADKSQTAPVTTTSAPEQPILVWEATEFTEYDRPKSWYTYAVVVGILLIIASLLLKQWLGAVVFALATFVVVRHADDKPRTLTYSVTKLGVHAGDKFLPWSELKQFWIIYNPPAKSLHLQSTGRFKPITKIHLGDLDPIALKNTLKPYLPEEAKAGEDFLDKFSRFIKL